MRMKWKINKIKRINNNKVNRKELTHIRRVSKVVKKEIIMTNSRKENKINNQDNREILNKI